MPTVESQWVCDTWEWWAPTAREEARREPVKVPHWNTSHWEVLGLMALIAFLKISAVTLNKSSVLLKSEEQPGRHPKCRLPFPIGIPPRSSQRGVGSLTPHTSLPQVTVRKYMKHPAQLQNSRGRKEAGAACRALSSTPGTSCVV